MLSLSIYKRLHDVILLPLSHKMLVTKHNKWRQSLELSKTLKRSETFKLSETLEEMGAERSEILV